MPVIDEIAAERRRQYRTPECGTQHANGEMARAAGCYALVAGSKYRVLAEQGISPTAWPWPRESWNPTSRRGDLIKAAALIVAEIERLDRASVTEGA